LITYEAWLADENASLPDLLDAAMSVLGVYLLG